MPMSALMIGSIEKVDFVLAHRAIQTGGTAVILRGAAACGDVGGVFAVRVGAVSEGCECWGADANETGGDFRGAGDFLAGSLMDVTWRGNAKELTPTSGSWVGTMSRPDFC